MRPRLSIRTLGMVVLAAVASLAIARAGAEAATSVAAAPLLKVQVIGLGTVTGPGISCGNGKLECAASYSAAGSKQLSESPASGWAFAGWHDDCTGGSSNCTVDVNDDQTVTAVFITSGAVGASTLQVSLGGGGSGTVTNKSSSSGTSDYSVNCTYDGTSTSGTCHATVVDGSTLTLEAQPGGSSLFSAWGGACQGDHATCTVQLNDNRNVSASFTSGNATQLTVNVNGAGSVGVDNYTCTSGSTCTYSEPPNAILGLTAIPDKGYAFVGWTDDCSGTQNQCKVQMTTDHTVTATFAQLVPILITVSGDGTVNGPGISCGPGTATSDATCSATAAPGTTIELTATPGPTSTNDVSWAGCNTAAGVLCTVIVGTEPESIEADFTAGTNTGGGGGGGGGSLVSVTAHVTGAGYITAQGTALYCTSSGGPVCSISVQQNTSLNFVATPAPGATFSGWSGGSCAGSSIFCSLVINGSKSVNASFTGGTPGTHTLSVAAHGTGSGTVTGLGIHCPASGGLSCSSPEPAQIAVTLTATPSSGSTFAGWGGACSGTSPICTVSMTTDQAVIANFTASSGGGGGGGGTEQTLTLEVAGSGKVTFPGSACAGTNGKTTSCTTLVRTGTSVALKAVPTRGFAFAGWKGACTGGKTTCTVTMDKAETVTATFRRLVLAPSSKKPTVARVAAGYRITLRYVATEAGRLNAVARHPGRKPAAATKKIKPGVGLIRVTVKKTGRYVVVLTLHTKSGAHAIRYTVRV